ncbi:MAG: hypothetical protein ABI180_19460 [Microcoleus sp.]|jgi:hypothetical protein
MTIKTFSILLTAVGRAIFYDIAIAYREQFTSLTLNGTIAFSLTSVTRTIAPTQITA